MSSRLGVRWRHSVCVRAVFARYTSLYEHPLCLVGAITCTHAHARRLTSFLAMADLFAPMIQASSNPNSVSLDASLAMGLGASIKNHHHRRHAYDVKRAPSGSSAPPEITRARVSARLVSVPCDLNPCNRPIKRHVCCIATLTMDCRPLFRKPGSGRGTQPPWHQIDFAVIPMPRKRQLLRFCRRVCHVLPIDLYSTLTKHLSHLMRNTQHHPICGAWKEAAAHDCCSEIGTIGISPLPCRSRRRRVRGQAGSPSSNARYPFVRFAEAAARSAGFYGFGDRLHNLSDIEQTRKFVTICRKVPCHRSVSRWIQLHMC